MAQQVVAETERPGPGTRGAARLEQSGSDRPRRGRTLVVFLAAVVVGFAAVALWLVTRDDAGRSAPEATVGAEAALWAEKLEALGRRAPAVVAAAPDDAVLWAEKQHLLGRVAAVAPVVTSAADADAVLHAEKQGLVQRRGAAAVTTNRDDQAELQGEKERALAPAAGVVEPSTAEEAATIAREKGLLVG